MAVLGLSYRVQLAARRVGAGEQRGARRSLPSLAASQRPPAQPRGHRARSAPGIKLCAPQPAFQPLFQPRPSFTLLYRAKEMPGLICSWVFKNLHFSDGKFVFKVEGSVQTPAVLVLFVCLFFLFIPVIFHQGAKNPQGGFQSVLEVK